MILSYIQDLQVSISGEYDQLEMSKFSTKFFVDNCFSQNQLQIITTLNILLILHYSLHNVK